jgi:hypothetical protein
MEDQMKRVAWIGTMALALGLALPAFAQDAPKDEPKPAESKPAEKPAESKPAPKPAAKPATKPATTHTTTHAANKPQETKPQETKPEEKPAEHAENKPAPKPESKPKPAPSHNDAARNDAEHRDTKTVTRENTKATTRNVSQQRNDAHRIPDDKYREHFGREHTFHISRPVAVGGHYNFSYGGYSFYYTEAWPAGWGYGDELYIVDVNGVYYLMDAAHPGVQLALVINL